MICYTTYHRSVPVPGQLIVIEGVSTVTCKTDGGETAMLFDRLVTLGRPTVKYRTNPLKQRYIVVMLVGLDFYIPSAMTIAFPVHWEEQLPCRSLFDLDNKEQELRRRVFSS
jgi:hypothetical protein